MAVALDVAGSETLTAAGVSSPQTYTGLTTGLSLSNGAVTAIVITDTQVAGGAATWDSVSMTKLKTIAAAGGTGQVEIYGLSPIGSHTGNKTFSYSWTGGTTAQVIMLCQSWTGVDQTGGVTSFPHANSATGSAQNGSNSVSITSATGDAIIAGHVCGNTYGSVNNTGFTMNSGTGFDNTPASISAASNRASGAASVAMTATFTGGAATNWASAGVDILAFVAAAAPTIGWKPRIYDDRNPPVRRNPDEATTFFRGPSPPILVPRFDGGERPSAPRDQSIAAFVPQAAASAAPVGISGMAWYLPQEGMRPPGPKDQYSLTWDSRPVAAATSTISGMAWSRAPDDMPLPPKRSPDDGQTFYRAIYPVTWLPGAGDTDLHLPPLRRLDDAEAFVAVAAAIPSIAGWKAGDGNEKPLVIRRADDTTGFFVAPKPVSTPNVLWFVPYDQPPYVTKPDVSAPSLTLKPPPPPVGIAGMAWWQAIEVHLPPPPPQLDYSPAWDPQFEQQINPPAPVAQFTVSGVGVSLTFTEFFVDVVLTDAPVTKRTN